MPAATLVLSAGAIALPFLWAYTEAPTANVWPLLFAWSCAAVLLAVQAGRAAVVPRPGARPGGAAVGPGLAVALAWGLLGAALVSGVIGLVQYFVGDVGLRPWVHPSWPGQAVGNLRQRNQHGSLMTLGVWSLVWLVAHGQSMRPAPAVPTTGAANGTARAWRAVLAGVGLVWALALLAASSAATASRTGALQWLLVLALVGWWGGRQRTHRWALALGLAGLGVALYLAFAWLLPEWLWRETGVREAGLFDRLSEAGAPCTSRRALWANMLTLIGQRPWVGWGWGELDYAHYITRFPGERFCVLLDNAHNLPLHLAVELGLPLAVLICGGVGAWVLRSRPWAESRPYRQLAWGALGVVGVHSLLEYPLWYGPFQLITLVAVALLLMPQPEQATPRWATRISAIAGAAAVVVLAVVGLVAWDYHRVSQWYKPVAARAPAYRNNLQVQVTRSVFFQDQLDFARLTTQPVTVDNAPQMLALARAMLHYSPEPRVIERLIASATLLGLPDEADAHRLRYRLAYPKEYARWRQTGQGAED